jgi:hypothetical protein
MYQGLLHLHNLGRWLIIILLVIAIINAFAGMRRNEPFSKGDKKIGLFLMIVAHTMLLIGLYQWIAGPWGLKQFQQLGMGGVMKNSIARFWAVEHMLGMIISIVLITIGRSAAKKNISDRAKHKKMFWMFFIAFIIIIASVPWPGRQVGRPLLPGMSQSAQVNTPAVTE